MFTPSDDFGCSDIFFDRQINIWKCISESKFLELLEGVDITPAVGKWHLAAHVRECFTKFSLNFIEGSAEVDGEIIETLWSGLDLVAGLTQAMSVAHWQEVLDDYINDSNWKKLLRICTPSIHIAIN